MASATGRLPCLAMHAIHAAHLGMSCRSPSARCRKQACIRVRACCVCASGVRERACLHACVSACVSACLRACLRACQALPWCRACRMYNSRSTQPLPDQHRWDQRVRTGDPQYHSGPTALNSPPIPSRCLCPSLPPMLSENSLTLKSCEPQDGASRTGQ
jgi:hypothetical protein